MAADPRIIIAGGGWAGFAAAVELADHGLPVTLLESARQLGGRARRTAFGDYAVDNGQHLLIGAYREFLRLLRRIGVPEEQQLHRTPLRLPLRSADATVTLGAPNLPAPLHLALALLAARGLSMAERYAALRMALQLALARYEVAQDISVAALLRQHRQPPRVSEWLWAPLCLATLNVPVEEASARVFLRVLRDAFSHARRDSDLLLPRCDLGRVFPDPAGVFIERHRGTVRLNARVTALRSEQERICGVAINVDEVLDATHLVLATPASASAALLGAIPATRELARQLAELDHTPIATVYLRYEEGVRLEAPMLGLVGTLSQWVFDRGMCEQPGLMAVVISGHGIHMAMKREELAAHVANELAEVLGWPAPLESFVVREKRATFHCGVDVDARRPGFATPLAGLWLAGDYTATGYPATLEGAVRSGVQCARLILADLGRTPRGIPS